ncbi:MAG: DUF4249 domain-containing protein [Saprospiraceae bacterium]|nr:DUF4249 domain-containing protein [Saprospiraceae bacterium]
MKNIILLISLLALFITSCQDVVNLDLPEGDVLLVVDGWITNQEGEKRVLLTNTANYFDNKETPKVSGALVILYNETGVVDTLNEKEAGVYITEHVGKIGSTYHIYIKTKEGEEYESQPELLQFVPEIDSIYAEFKEESIFEDEGYYVKIDTYEPQGVGNYYRWRQFVNNEYKSEPFDLLYASDEFVDGNPIIGYELNFDPLEIGDHYRVQQMSISRAAYDFLFLLEQQTAFVGSLFDTPPATIKGNIFRVDEPKVKVLGFFGASAVAEATIVIE